MSIRPLLIFALLLTNTALAQAEWNHEASVVKVVRAYFATEAVANDLTELETALASNALLARTAAATSAKAVDLQSTLKEAVAISLSEVDKLKYLETKAIAGATIIKSSVIRLRQGVILSGESVEGPVLEQVDSLIVKVEDLYATLTATAED